MGRRSFSRLLAPRPEPVSRPEPGAPWGADVVSCDRLLEPGCTRSDLIQARRAYAVDPTAGIGALASLFAVATVPDATLLSAIEG
jgi:hypothetical protein